jgi:Calx-beta domain
MPDSTFSRWRRRVRGAGPARARLAVERLEDRNLLSNSWTALGPAPLGAPSVANSGRIVGVAAHPTDSNTLYIAAAGGGVWKTTDGGTTWAPKTDDQATLFMGSIAVARSNPNVVYAGTGEANNAGDSYYGRGILKSTDAGATWSLLGNAQFNRATIAKVVVDPQDANRVYAAVDGFGTNGLNQAGVLGIWRSTDGGANWTLVLDPLGAPVSGGNPQFSDLVMDPTTTGATGVLYAAVGTYFGDPGNGIYKSTNGGAMWTKLAGGLPTTGTTIGRIALAVAPSNTSVVYASIAGSGQAGSTSQGSLFRMMRSDNGGSTWTNLTSGTPNYMGGQGWYDTTLIVDPSNSAIVYAAGQAGTNSILRSTNSGVNWTDIHSGGSSPHADHHGIAFDASGRLLDGDDGGLYRLTSVSPVSWADLNGNLNTIQFTGVGLHPTDATKAVGGSQDNGTEVYNNSVVWTETDGGDGGFAKYSPTNGNRVYHNAPPGSFGTSFFRRSDNGGTTWATKTLSISTDVNVQNFYAPFVVSPVNGDRVLYGTNRVWETTTAGDSWTPISTVLVNTNTFVDAIGLAASDVNTVYAAFGGEFASSSKIFVTTNHGSSWTEHDLPSGNGRVADLQVDPTNAQIAYAVVSNFGGGHVFRTINGGVSWTNISGNLPALPTWTLQLLSGTNTLYVGTDDGVYVSNDLGGSWSRFGIGFPRAQVVQLELNTTLNLLAAGTHGRGMWTSVVRPLVTLSLSGSPFAENGGTATVTATLSAVPGQDVTVNLGFSGTATEGVDYTHSATAIVIPAGQLSGSITLTGVDDALNEGDETVVVDVTTVTNGTESGTQQVTAVITDDDPPPSVQFTAAAQSVGEAAGTVTVTVALSAPSGRTVTVPYTLGGTATGGGVDYTITPSPVTIPAGATTATITVTVVDDTIAEPDETVVLTLGSPTNATLGGTTVHTLTIVDNDSPPSVQAVQVNDGNVQRSMVTSLTVTFSEVVTLAAGAFEIRDAGGNLIPATITVTTQVVGGHTLAILTFSGTGVIGGSLADGRYTLTVRADHVSSSGAPAAMAADYTFAFFRLFGDGNGDGVVDIDDLLAFASAYGSGSGAPSYVPWFDYDADGVIDVNDLLAFADRYGTGI